MASGDDQVRSLWLEVRAAASTMSLWGQVAAGEVVAGEIAQRILTASERLINVIEHFEEATGWSGDESPDVDDRSELERPAAAPAHCVLGLLLGSEWPSTACGVGAAAEEMACLRARVQALLERPCEDPVAESEMLECGELGVDGHTAHVADQGP